MDNQNRRARDKRAPGTVEWDESSKPATSVPAPVSPTDLHDAIMRLPCNPPGGRGALQYNGYVSGHRDARHAAAELIAASQAEPEQAAQVRADVRDEALEDAAVTCEQIGTDWLDAGDHQKEFAADYLAKAIRAMKSKRAASTDGEAQS